MSGMLLKAIISRSAPSKVHYASTDRNNVNKRVLNRNTIRKLKNIAPGLHNIPNERLKYPAQKLINQITKLYQNALSAEKWKQSRIFLIINKGDKEYPENYRQITLLSRLMNRIHHYQTHTLEKVSGQTVPTLPLTI